MAKLSFDRMQVRQNPYILIHRQNKISQTEAFKEQHSFQI